MNLFISSFKPILVAATFIVLIEFTISIFPDDNNFQGNFFELSFRKQETIQRLIIYEKLKHLKADNKEIIQVGDSSGLFGVKTDYLNKYIGKPTYLNYSCCANTGYDGYLTMLEYALKKTENPKVALFYLTPMFQPGRFENSSLDKSVVNEFLGPGRLLNSLPSMRWRVNVINALYYRRFDNDLFEMDVKSEVFNASLRDWVDTLMLTGGWLPDTDATRVATFRECNFTVGSNISLSSKLEKFYEYTQDRGLKMAVVFNPVPCTSFTGEDSAFLQKQVVEFKNTHPDVYIPYDLITPWPSWAFTGPWHVKPDMAYMNTERLGDALLKGYPEIFQQSD